MSPRRSYPCVGIDPATFAALKPWAKERGYPVQQVVSQAIEAVMAGEIKLDEAVCSRRLQSTTMLLRSPWRTEIALRRVQRRKAKAGQP